MSLLIPAWKLPEIRRAIVAAEKEMPEDQRGTELTRAHTATLRSANLWWASADMSTLAISTADTLPAWSPEIVRPAPTGFMLWQRPIGHFSAEQPAGYDDQGNAAEAMLGDSDIMAVHWSIIGQYLTFTFYGHVESREERKRSKAMYKGLYELGVFTTLAPRDVHPGQVNLADPVADQALQIIGASWLLMQQPTVSDVRKDRRSLGGGRMKKKPAKRDIVQIIDLRRLASDKHRGHGTGEGREYSHRWLVRGYWRQQRVGPGRKQLRPVFVSPHIRGPEDAPLKEGRVNAWRR